jgi:aminopeptidase N
MIKLLRLLFALLLFFPSSFFPQDNNPLIQYAPNREFHMLHIDLNLHFNIEKKEIIGVATEKIVPLRVNYKTVHLDAIDMNIQKVNLGDENLNFTYNGKILSINLNRPYGLSDTLTISIAYSSIPKKGIYFVLPDSAYKNRTPQLWSQSESEDAQYWFPCHDYPDDFSTSSLTATVPKDWVVVSNGALKNEVTNKIDNTKTFTWVESKPHVVYLNSIVAGKFKILKTSWDDVPIYYYVEPEFVEDAKLNFSHTPDILKYFSEITGYHYAWEKLSLSGVADFTEGGMENVSAITLTDRTFHGINDLPNETTTDLVSHETAHQWFGDLLTCRTWGDSWLNEGFATYFEALYGEHAFGKDHFIYEMYSDHQIVLKAEKYKRQPTVYTGNYNPDDVFTPYIYERGASILHMLKGILGDELFFKAIKHYVKEYQFENVDSHDFENAVTEATGMNLYWFFDEWLNKGGHPVFDINYNYFSDKHKLILHVAQAQTVDSLTPIYKMPVEVCIVTPKEKISKTIWVDSTDNTFEFDVQEKPLMVNFDENNILLKEVNFNKTVDELAYQLENDSNVVGRIWAAQQLGKSGDDRAIKFLDSALHKDTFWAVRAECATVLGEFSNNDAAKNALLNSLNDNDPHVKVAVINALKNFQGKDVTSKLITSFHSSKIYQIKAAAIASLANSDSAKALPLIEEALKLNTKNEDIRSAALTALLKVDPDKAYKTALNFSEYGNPSELRVHAITILSQSNKNIKETVRVLENLTRDSYWLIRIVSVGELGRLGDKDVIPLLEKIAKSDSSFRVVEAAKRSIEEINKRSEEM